MAYEIFRDLPMSAFRKMPSGKSMRTFRYSVWFFVTAVVGTLALLKYFGQPDGLPLKDILAAIFLVGIVAAFVIEHYFATYQRCPDCNRAMRVANEDVHPKAQDYHLLYCEHCDIIWDTTIPKAND